MAVYFKNITFRFYSPKKENVKSLTVKYDRTKGKLDNAGLTRTIDVREDKDMCFINRFSLYLLYQYNIKVTEYNELKLSQDWESKLVWNISRNAHHKLVKYTLKR